MIRRFLLMVLLAVVGGAAGFVMWDTHAGRTPPTLVAYGAVPPFTLIDHAGQAVSRDSLRGSVWVANFIFTRCAGQCPMMSAEMAQLATAIDREDAVKMVSFTVDPAWDTPEVLARYAQAYQAAPGQWHFVTGDQEAIWRLCREGFRLAVGDGDGTPQEPITHSVRVVLVDPAGIIRGTYDATDAGARQRLRRDLQRLLRAHFTTSADADDR